MSILVVCPGCHTRFKVSDQFAGKTGGCPKCKAPIRVPSKDEEVKVHAPAEFSSGGRSTTGKLVLKPLPRVDTPITPLSVGLILGAALAMTVGAWAAGEAMRESMLLRGVGLILVSPGLVWAAYAFLRDQEREPYQGQALFARMAIVSLGYAALWGLFAYLSDYMVADQAWSWIVFGAPCVVIGALISLACFDFEFGTAAFHYSFFVLVTIVLRWLAGMGWIWQTNVPSGM